MGFLVEKGTGKTVLEIDGLFRGIWELNVGDVGIAC